MCVFNVIRRVSRACYNIVYVYFANCGKIAAIMWVIVHVTVINRENGYARARESRTSTRRRRPANGMIKCPSDKRRSVLHHCIEHNITTFIIIIIIKSFRRWRTMPVVIVVWAVGIGAAYILFCTGASRVEW